LGFVNVYFMRYSLVADHWQYFAMPAVLVLVAVGLAQIPAPVHRVVAALLLAILGTMTWRYAASYADQETLWRATLAQNPQAYVAHLNLGAILLERAEDELPAPAVKKSLVEEAVWHFEQA